jgi:hypothetical protein
MISSKIQRLEEYLGRRSRAAVFQNSHNDESSSPSELQYPTDISSMKEKCIWRCQLDLDAVLPAKTLQHLIDLTGCAMVRSLKEDVIYIGAASEENIHRAISKLDNLSKYAVS